MNPSTFVSPENIGDGTPSSGRRKFPEKDEGGLANND
jgi:hypothetical protein